MSERNEMLHYINGLACILDDLGVHSSFHKDEEQVVLYWYDNVQALNSLSFNLHTFEGIWKATKDGRVLDGEFFTGIDEFKEFTIT